jgi:hypothetical protein
MSGSTRVFGPGHLALLAVAIVPASCTTQVMQPAAAAVAPQLSVERFLQAANSRDLQGMGRLFGTPDGPVMETGSSFGCMFKKIGSWFGGAACTTRQDVEIRMDAISSILRHENYRIVREEMVAGRDIPTTGVVVTLTINGQSVDDVPFLVVQASGGRWLVQEVGLERVMTGR